MPAEQQAQTGPKHLRIRKKLQIEIVSMLSHPTLNGITAELISTVKADSIEESVVTTKRNGA